MHDSSSTARCNQERGVLIQFAPATLRHREWIPLHRLPRPRAPGMNLMVPVSGRSRCAIVTARNKKLLKRLMATPMSRYQYLLSFLFSRLFFLILEVVTLVGFGYFAFGVPLRGSVGTLFLIALLGAVSFGGLGLLCASRARTVEAASGLSNFVMLPRWVFSGVFFSSANFPEIVQPFIRLLPLTASTTLCRKHARGRLPGGGFPAAADHLRRGIVSFFAALNCFAGADRMISPPPIAKFASCQRIGGHSAEAS